MKDTAFALLAWIILKINSADSREEGVKRGHICHISVGILWWDFNRSSVLTSSAMTQCDATRLAKLQISWKNGAVQNDYRDFKVACLLPRPLSKCISTADIFPQSNLFLLVIQQETLSPGELLPYHLSNSNHPHKFKGSMVSITSPCASPVHFIHLVYCLTICLSVLEDLQ